MTLNLENKRLELNAFLAIWYVLAMLLPDLLGFALRDWRAAVVGAVISTGMIALSLRLSSTVRGRPTTATTTTADGEGALGRELLAARPR